MAKTNVLSRLIKYPGKFFLDDSTKPQKHKIEVKLVTPIGERESFKANLLSYCDKKNGFVSLKLSEDPFDALTINTCTRNLDRKSIGQKINVYCFINNNLKHIKGTAVITEGSV